MIREPPSLPPVLLTSVLPRFYFVPCYTNSEHNNQSWRARLNDRSPDKHSNNYNCDNLRPASLSFHLGSLTPSPVGVRAGANRSSVYLDRDELPGALIEHREVACCDLEVSTVKMEPALAFERLDAGKAAQVSQGDLDPDAFELGT